MEKIQRAAQWIWLSPDCHAVNSYIDFRKEFELETPVGAGLLQISAIGDFLAQIDGIPIGRGQFSDYPEAPTFSEFPLPSALAAGRHVIAITGYRPGTDFSTFRDGPPGLCALLELGSIAIPTDHTWRSRPNPAYRSGPIEHVTSQLAFTFCYDARNEDGWLRAGFDDSGWAFAEPVARPVPVKRPVPQQHEGERIAGVIATQGRLFRAAGEGSFADQVRATAMRQVPGGVLFGLAFEFGSTPLRFDGTVSYVIPPPEAPENGSFVTVDLGGEKAGLLELELDAPAGTVLDVSHGEHLADGRVRCRVGNRHFTDRYICREGRNRFRHPFRRLGCRYLELSITGAERNVTLHYIGLVPLTLPLPEESCFSNGDTLDSRLRAVAINTLRLCMHEHYEDCPWREQALYAYDSRNQALYGYQVWGNYAFAGTAFDLLGRGIRPDLLLELCAPARCGVTIPIFSFIWITALEEFGRYSGDDRLFFKFASQMEAMLQAALDRTDPETGLCHTPEGKGIWNFYEWLPDLSGTTALPPGTLSAPYNLYLLLALQGYTAMCNRNHRETAVGAPQLAEAIRRGFRNDREECFMTFRNKGELYGLHEHTNALAFVTKVADHRDISGVRTACHSGKLIKAGTSPLPFVIDMLMEFGPEARVLAANRIREAFTPMLFSGHDTLWETQRGERDFDGAGSLCHAWSSVSVYFNGACELGVRPLEQGFRKFRVAPYPGVHQMLSGTIPTPSGPIAVRCRRGEEGLELTVDCPSGCRPELVAYPEFPVVRFTVNGRRREVN